MSTALIALCALGCPPTGGQEEPIIEDIPAQLAAVNQELIIEIVASDPDGDRLSYGFHSNIEDLPSRAQLTTTPLGVGKFRWTPQASDIGTHNIDFTASDSRFTARLTVQIEIRSAIGINAAPAFQEPLGRGAVLDLNLSQCLDLDIVIRDSDSANVRLKQAEPRIAGATLDQLDGLTGEWHWCPSDNDLITDRYTLTLTADDGEHPLAILRYLIVLRRPVRSSCPGESPIITHTPQDHSSTANLTISAMVSDAEGLRSAPLVFYSTTHPGSPLNLSTMTLAEMTNTGGDNWQASVPNPTVDIQASSSATLYYVIQARDNDDTVGNCDHEVLSPITGTHRIAVQNTNAPGNQELCSQCQADIQCGNDTDDLCVRVDNDGHARCLSGCINDASCPTHFICSPRMLSSVQLHTGRVCVPTADSCERNAICADDLYENNDTRAETANHEPLTPGTITAKSCPLLVNEDDEDWYRIVLTEPGRVMVQLNGTNDSDLDIKLISEAGSLLQSETSTSSMESFSTCLAPGTYYLWLQGYPNRNNGFTLLPNQYSLSYEFTPRACNSSQLCLTDDSEEPNDTQQSATETTARGVRNWRREGLLACEDDDDWYQIFLLAGYSLDITATFNHAQGDIDMELFYTDFISPADKSHSVSNNEHIHFEIDDHVCRNGCYYYLNVYAFQGQNTYDLIIESGP